MTEKKEPENKDLDKTPKRRESKFAARMAKKRTTLDQKISKLRKKASAGRIKKEEVLEDIVSSDSDIQNTTISIKSEPIPETLTATTSINPQPLPADEESKKEKEKELTIEADLNTNTVNVSTEKSNIRSKISKNTTDQHTIHSEKPSKSSPKQNPSSPSPTQAGRFSGANRAGTLSGFGSNSTNFDAEPLINGFLEKLDAYPDHSFLNDYKLRARDLLSNHLSVRPSILVLSNTPKGEESLMVECANRTCSWLPSQFPSAKETSPAVISSYAHFEAILRAGWTDIVDLSPAQIGALREHIDIILVESFPRDINNIQLAPALQRLYGNGRRIILAGADFISAQTANNVAIKGAKRGFSVLDESRITELDIGDYNHLLEAFSARLGDSDAEAEYRPFVSNRRIFELASQLETRCEYELKKLSLVSAVSNSGATKYDPTQLEKGLDANINKILSEGRKQVSSQETHIDSLGQAILSEQESSLDTASALISGFSINDVVMLDELDIQKFSPDDRKYINRIHRFRFASKLGNVWKLRQEYIESLHEKLLSRIENDAKTSFAKVDNYYKNTLKDLENAHKEEEKPHIKTLSQELLTAWPSSQQLLDSIKIENNISHFRSALFNKRGSNAPIETQQGVMKELRESRMFVSQLMAFGMLFALLFGSSFAVDVLVNWFSGGSDSIGSELTQAAKDSRGLGRQIRILIQAIAGVAIIVYISLRFYLKPAEKLLDRGKLVSTYSAQLEDVCASFLDAADKASKEIIQSHIQHLQQKYDEMKAHSVNQTASNSMDSTGTARSETIRAIQDIKKWASSQILKKETISINKTLNSSTSALLAKITQ